MSSRRVLRFGFALAGLLVGAPYVVASNQNHLMQIEQVIGGVNGDTSAQAIQLRMRAVGQHLVTNTRIRVRDATGSNPITLKILNASVVSGQCRRILLASPGFIAATTPQAVPDFPMDALIPESYLAAGSLTYESAAGTVWWRLSWGGFNYTGPNVGSPFNDSNGNFGPPFSGVMPSDGLLALRFTPPCPPAASSSNAADYALTPGPAVFTNNSFQNFTVSGVPVPGACCTDFPNPACENTTEDLCTGLFFEGEDCDAGFECPDCQFDADCGDGIECNGVESCDGGSCVDGMPVDCSNFDDECAIGTCHPTTGECVALPANEGEDCDDGNLCTANEACSAGECSGAPVECPEGESCDPKTGECVPDCGPCPTDVDGNGFTDAFDLANLLGAWGPCDPGDPCECLDADGNGIIDAFDLATLLGAWGPCQ